MVRKLIETIQRWAHQESDGLQKDAPPKAWLTAEEDSLVPPRHLWIGPRDPISHYYRWIWEYLAYLTLLTDLRRRSTVLELGCGHGRLARGLLDYLRSPGAYYGIDVDANRLADADARLHRRHPNFHFIHADVYNRQYHPAGRIAARDYVFPFEDSTFDVIFAASLFTHLLPDETLGYFQQSARVLKPAGKCLFSCFVLDNYRGRETSVSPDYVFDDPLPDWDGVAVRFREFPDALIGYRTPLIEHLAGAAGLQVLKLFPGLWTGITDWAVNEHDLVLLGKA